MNDSTTERERTQRQDPLEMLSRRSLTPRQLAVLRKMRDEDEELVYSRGTGYIGHERVSGRTLFALLRVMAISLDQYSETSGRGCERYAINETGKQLLNTQEPK